jgi:hypothetical protein
MRKTRTFVTKDAVSSLYMVLTHHDTAHHAHPPPAPALVKEFTANISRIYRQYADDISPNGGYRGRASADGGASGEVGGRGLEQRGIMSSRAAREQLDITSVARFVPGGSEQRQLDIIASSAGAARPVARFVPGCYNTLCQATLKNSLLPKS